MNKRGLVIGLLVMLAVITSGFTYAFWASSVAGDDKEVIGTINIGSGSAVTTTVAVDPEVGSGLLVPTAFKNDTTTFDTIALTFSVAWTQDAIGAAGTTGVLDVSIDSWDVVDALDVSTGLTLGEKAAMFTVVITSGDGETLTLGDSQDVVITITFIAEPATKDLYDKVATGKIVINLTFDIPTASLTLPGE